MVAREKRILLKQIRQVFASGLCVTDWQLSKKKNHLKKMEQQPAWLAFFSTCTHREHNPLPTTKSMA